MQNIPSLIVFHLKMDVKGSPIFQGHCETRTPYGN